MPRAHHETSHKWLGYLSHPLRSSSVGLAQIAAAQQPQQLLLMSCRRMSRSLQTWTWTNRKALIFTLEFPEVPGDGKTGRQEATTLSLLAYSRFMKAAWPTTPCQQTVQPSWLAPTIGMRPATCACCGETVKPLLFWCSCKSTMSHRNNAEK